MQPSIDRTAGRAPVKAQLLQCLYDAEVVAEQPPRGAERPQLPHGRRRLASPGRAAPVDGRAALEAHGVRAGAAGPAPSRRPSGGELPWFPPPRCSGALSGPRVPRPPPARASGPSPGHGGRRGRGGGRRGWRWRPGGGTAVQGGGRRLSAAGGVRAARRTCCTGDAQPQGGPPGSCGPCWKVNARCGAQCRAGGPVLPAPCIFYTVTGTLFRYVPGDVLAAPASSLSGWQV